MVRSTTQELPIAFLSSHKPRRALLPEQMPTTVNAQATIDELAAIAHAAFPLVDHANVPDGVKGFRTPAGSKPDIVHIGCLKAQYDPIDCWHNR
jgi:hypothetical protein